MTWPRPPVCEPPPPSPSSPPQFLVGDFTTFTVRRQTIAKAFFRPYSQSKTKLCHSLSFESERVFTEVGSIANTTQNEKLHGNTLNNDYCLSSESTDAIDANHGPKSSEESRDHRQAGWRPCEHGLPSRAEDCWEILWACRNKFRQSKSNRAQLSCSRLRLSVSSSTKWWEFPVAHQSLVPTTQTRHNTVGDPTEAVLDHGCLHASRCATTGADGQRQCSKSCTVEKQSEGGRCSCWAGRADDCGNPANPEHCTFFRWARTDRCRPSRRPRRLWEDRKSPRGNTPHCAWVQWF